MDVQTTEKKLAADALALIQQLQADTAQQARCIENMTDKLNAMNDEVAKLQAERDAAVEHVKRLKRCADCKHATITLKGNIIWVDCPKQDGRCSAKSLWQWRGVPKEDGNEKT